MPELPEVETVRRGLHARLKNRYIDSVLILRSGREFPREKIFVDSILHKKIKKVDRRAKLIIFSFEDGDSLIAHLKMTGRFVFVESDHQPQKHDAVIFSIGDIKMVWSDVRKFGYLKYVSREGLKEILSKYGVEPLAVMYKEIALTLTLPKTRTIKAALLDQAKIAGIGNIYADESLHRAGIHPTRRLQDLNMHEKEKLAKEIQRLLKESIVLRGTSVNDYVDSTGRKGGFADLLRVYGRKAEPCFKCATPIERIVLAGRGTHYCSRCQK